VAIAFAVANARDRTLDDHAVEAHDSTSRCRYDDARCFGIARRYADRRK
jgi:hypothetical protein